MLTEIHRVQAGNTVHVEFEADRPEGSIEDISGSTATVTVRDFNGTSITLSETVTALTPASVMVEADWDLLDAQPQGWYQVRAHITDATSGFKAYRSVKVYVEAQ